MELLNKPHCNWPNCSDYALTLVNGKWLCGKHTIKAIQNLNELNQEIMFKE